MANKTLTQSAQSLTVNLSANAVPTDAISDILKNFLYIYISIIIFYFTSRSIDSYSDSKTTEALKTSSPLEIARMRYARGKISKEELAEMAEVLPRLPLADNKSALDKISEMWKTSDVENIAKEIGYPKDIVNERIEKMIRDGKLQAKETKKG